MAKDRPYHTVKIIQTEGMAGEPDRISEYTLYEGYSPGISDHIAEWGSNLILNMIGES